MGHVTTKAAYLALQERLDKMPIGAPANRFLFEILAELFSEEEARVAAAVPMGLTSARRIAANADMDLAQAREVIDRLVEKGLLADLPRSNGSVSYFLNPTMVGFFEFTMMRVRTDIDQQRVGKLFHEYLRNDPERAFFKAVAEGETFFARPLVHEDVLEADVYSEVLDYEKASQIIEEGGQWAEAMCYCRHVKTHTGEACDYPRDFCLSFGQGANYLIRRGFAQAVSKEHALEVLHEARERGMVQMGDNVKNQPHYMCNCCPCCCEMLAGLREFPGPTPVVTSNYVAVIEDENCLGCGKCATACPVNAIEMHAAKPTASRPTRKKAAVVDADRCLGCGVCRRSCTHDALSLHRIGQRVHTPENMMEKMLLQAVEHGKLQNFLFADPGKVSHRMLGAVLGAILNLSPAKRLLAQKQIKSKFVNALLSVAPKP
ncbi:MAG: 4Fe-4S binding protein [Candidatus Lernaella stagnicola]|nr:4Fe-4S binding protein [Candidatus Lernaella stagnicola]